MAGFQDSIAIADFPARTASVGYLTRVRLCAGLGMRPASAFAIRVRSNFWKRILPTFLKSPLLKPTALGRGTEILL
jgi:hypothetical protein